MKRLFDFFRRSPVKGEVGSRYTVLAILASIYFLSCLALRTVLFVFEGDVELFRLSSVVRVYGGGMIYDLAALCWMLTPFVVNALLWPNTLWGRRGHAFVASALAACGLALLGVGSVGEFLFWNEFSSRFNFIAVDYLIYTREVVGNIEQSYPMVWIGLGIGGGLLAAMVLLLPRIWRSGLLPAPRFVVRVLVTGGFCLLLTMTFYFLDEGPHDWMASPAEVELASNGQYALFRAFRHNDLDYKRFYATLPDNRVASIMQEELALARQAELSPERAGEFMHTVQANGPPNRKNIILVSIESLGADYVESFGGKKGLTPTLTALSAESLIFTNLYATGLRTVRGLEALTLSLPPTPGRAVPIRERNSGLMSLGSVLEENGYESLYFYGGYSYFDNMRDFFTKAGYEVFDRTDIAAKNIHHETIWGVADEDLFTLSLAEMDRRSEIGKPFFSHIMTTSNHRPFSYPEGRIDIPSHTGRDGAVKYTDWAIGAFMAEAGTRSWFADTVFVFVADHTNHGRGRIDLPPENYHIPMVIYSPGFIQPGAIDWVASQIDVAPTILGLLNISYESEFFGQDIMASGVFHQRAFMANYLTVGYMEKGMVVELSPRQLVRVVRPDLETEVSLDDSSARRLIEEAESYYQTAARRIEQRTHL
ncbi:MAG: LTA synthase family protein [Proteobacteria bacterium]|nr:LTA synthase family protein [Pseudomonadota bacterium]MBU1688272.1 LTA synthase family protein [Pseudomonadota bacterium]